MLFANVQPKFALKLDEERLKRNLAGNLTRLRWAMGWGADELASQCAVNIQQVTRSETAEKMARSDLLARFALVFGVSTDFLLFHPATPIRKPKESEPRGFARAKSQKYADFLRKARNWRHNGKH